MLLLYVCISRKIKGDRGRYVAKATEDKRQWSCLKQLHLSFISIYLPLSSFISFFYCLLSPVAQATYLPLSSFIFPYLPYLLLCFPLFQKNENIIFWCICICFALLSWSGSHFFMLFITRYPSFANRRIHSLYMSFCCFAGYFSRLALS